MTTQTERTKLKGYEIVFYHKGYRLHAGNPQIFPVRKPAEIYKSHYEEYPWIDHEVCIEEIEYEGIPLSPYSTYNGRDIIDREHYFGLDACEIGDYFTMDMIDYFMDMLPPACMRSDCFQMGEPTSHKLNDNGKYAATYPTFKQISEDIWEYCGDCFKGENSQHGQRIMVPYVCI